MNAEVTEEERAEAFWNAPFALLVHDDSKEAMLEYANKKVCVSADARYLHDHDE